MSVTLPPPYEPLIDKDNKISEVWYRYFSNSAIGINALAAITTATTVVLSFATQTDQELTTAPAAIVTPSVQQYHPSAAKAWGFVTAAETTTPVLSAAYNAASVIGTTAQVVTVTLGIPFSSTNYAITMGVQTASFSTSDAPVEVTARTSIAFTMQSTGYTAISFACYGDQ